VPKKYNTERHFKQNHDTFNTVPLWLCFKNWVYFEEKERNYFPAKLLCKKCEEMKNMLRASYEILFLLLPRRKLFQMVRSLKKASLYLMNTLVTRTQRKWLTLFLEIQLWGALKKWRMMCQTKAFNC
jgi:hypothetical protein